MLNYCPIDFEPPRQEPIQHIIRTQKKPRENTECNYLIMFFVAGILILAISDQIKK